MKRIMLIAALMFVIASPAFAQEGPPQVIYSTKPISAELTDYLDAWLAVSPPSAEALGYVVTYTKVQPTGETQVSLAGVSIEAIPEDWSMFESGTVVWIGSVTVAEDGTVTPFPSAQAQRKAGSFFLAPVLPAGGGSYVAFPFQAGKAMIYGPRAVHGSGDYGTSGMLAVDLVSGDDLGAGAAPPYAYASDAGTIDYICDDGTTVAVRTHNSSTDDYFLYAHLLDNAGLSMSASFTRGALLGSIKYGSFDDDCGWAEQQEDHYHIHWMFEPSGGKFQAESCVLSTSTKKWTCGTETVGTGGWLRGGGGFGFGADDLGSVGSVEPTFWDYLIFGFINFIDVGLVNLLPDHQAFEFSYAVMSTARLVLRISYVLIRSHLSLRPFFAVIVYGIVMNAVMFVLWLAVFIPKTIKTLVPGA